MKGSSIFPFRKHNPLIRSAVVNVNDLPTDIATART